MEQRLIVLLGLALSSLLLVQVSYARLPSTVRVGSVFLEKEQEVHQAFRLGVESLKSRQLLNDTDIEFDIQYATPKDYFHLYTRACVEVDYGTMTLFGPSDPSLDEQLESISSVLGIPLISTAPRPQTNYKSQSHIMGMGIGFNSGSGESSSLSNHLDLTLSLHPTQGQLMNLVKDLATELKWKEISIIHDPEHGIIEPTSLAETLQILGRVSVHKATTDLRATLVQLRLRGARNIIIDTAIDNVQTVLQAALDTGMMTKSYNYIFTMLDMKSGNWSRLSYSEALIFGFSIIDEEKFLDFTQTYAPEPTTGTGTGKATPPTTSPSPSPSSTPAGSGEDSAGTGTGTGAVAGGLAKGTLLRGTTRVALTLDSVELFARGLEAHEDSSGADLSTSSSSSPASCSAERKWEIGEELKDSFSSVTFNGMTGPVSFSNGVRSRVKVDILKLKYDETKTMSNSKSPAHNVGFVLVGNWSEGNFYGEDGSDSKDGIHMFDRSMLTNENREINKTLVITTIAGSSCMSKSEVTGEDEGFCVDLAQHLSKLIGFYYRFRTVRDGAYGKVDPMTGQWDGMVGEVIRGEADMALADLTVTAARESVIDFTTPFMHTSLSILYKNADVSLDGLSTLLCPFSMWVWVSIALAFFVTSVSLRLVAWLSPFQKDDIIVAGSDRDHRANLGQHLSWINSMWLLASTLVLRGCDIRLQAASSRTIAVVWWLFSLLIIIIYASLISHWFDPGTGSATPQTIDGLLRNPLLEIGLIRGGSTNYFLQNSKREDIQKLWWRIQRSSETKAFQTSGALGIDEVKKGNGQFAFISEDRNFKHAMAQDCSLGVIGGIDTRAFAAVVSKGSDLREKLSTAILTLRESGVLHQLESKWWPVPSCAEAEVSGKPQVQFMNFIGPLTLLVFGIVMAIVIAMTERLFYHRRSHRGFFRTSTETGNGKIAINQMNDTESS